MLTRIYGTAFATKDELAEHLERLEQARARDHRKLGKELELFMFSELSPGSPFWMPERDGDLERADQAVAHGERRARLPRGQDADPLRRRAVQALRALARVPRQHVLHGRRGPVDGPEADELPGAHAALRVQRRSYRDLPIRYSEQGLVHRHEPSGTLHGLLRVRHITQDDAHIFCTEDQIEEEVIRCLEFGFAIYDRFGFEPRLELSTRPEKRIGTEDDVGPRRGGAAEARSTTAASRTRSTRATARSTARRSTCT